MKRWHTLPADLSRASAYVEARRLELRWSQRELAMRMRTSQPHISQIEHAIGGHGATALALLVLGFERAEVLELVLEGWSAEADAKARRTR